MPVLVFINLIIYLSIGLQYRNLMERKKNMFKSLMTATALALTLVSSTLASEIKIVQNDALNAL